MNSTFNEEAARSAITNATTDIEKACNDFKLVAEEVNAQLGQAGAAMGGNVGAAAASSFENESAADFNNLKANLNSFMGRVDAIVKANAATTSEVISTYGGSN